MSRKPSRSTTIAADDARLLTREQAAKRLAVSVTTIDRWTRRGILHRVDLFGLRRVLFNTAEIDQLAAGRSAR